MEKKLWLEKNKFYYETAKILRNKLANSPEIIIINHPSIYKKLNNFIEKYDTIKFNEDNPNIFDEAKKLLEKIK